MTKTIYCVQAYGGSDRRFYKGPLKEYAAREAALAAGRELSRRVAGVLVFSVSGSRELGCWTEPEILARHGRLPAAIELS